MRIRLGQLRRLLKEAKFYYDGNEISEEEVIKMFTSDAASIITEELQNYLGHYWVPDEFDAYDDDVMLDEGEILVDLDVIYNSMIANGDLGFVFENVDKLKQFVGAWSATNGTSLWKHIDTAVHRDINEEAERDRYTDLINRNKNLKEESTFEEVIAGLDNIKNDKVEISWSISRYYSEDSQWTKADHRYDRWEQRMKDRKAGIPDY